MLRFKAEARVAPINLTGRPAQRSIKMVAAVKLKSWLGGVNFENTSAARIARAGDKPQFAPQGRAENEIVIVPKGGLELLIPLADAAADRVRLPEIEGRACDVSCLPGRNELVVDRREPFSDNHQFVIEYVGTRWTA
jgi:hypothetical protein